ncbi:MAG: PASTA domain-containing protein [Bacteroidia bacterium]
MSFFSLVKTRKFWIHAVIASSTGIALLYGGFLMLDVYTQHGEEVEVPDFKGIYINDLEKFVQGYSLQFEIVDSVYSNSNAKGTVVEQDPQPGSKVKNERVVYLTVNAMLTRKIKMPNLIDLSLKQATSLLETYSLQVGMLRYVEGLPPVMEQLYKGKSVKEGELIDEGSKIDLVLGSGVNDGLIPIPDLTGFTVTEARILLQSKKLVLGVVSEDDPPLDTLVARIWKQNPEPSSGEGMYDGARVNIWLTESEALIQDKINNTVDEADEE